MAGTEVLLTGPQPWQNPVNRLDLNHDRSVTPADILDIIDRLNTLGSGPLSILPDPSDAPRAFHYDTNGDDFFTSFDILQIVNFLNAQANVNGEAEGEARTSPPSASRDELFGILATRDFTELPRRLNTTGIARGSQSTTSADGATIRVARPQLVAQQFAVAPDDAIEKNSVINEELLESLALDQHSAD